MATKIILDVDTGTDDAVALMTAALSPDIDLVGATVVNGNTVLDSTAWRTRSASFEWIGMPEIPVFRGMSRPLARPQMAQLNPATRIHGDKLDLPRGDDPGPGAQHAVDWLIDTLPRVGRRHHAGPGGAAHEHRDGDPEGAPDPRADPRDRDHGRRPRPRELDGLGRVQHLAGPRGRADRRQLRPADPDGAAGRDPPGARLARGLPSALRALGTPAGEAACRFISKRIEGYDATQPMHRAGAAPVHDALAVCAVIDPSVITTHFIPVDVETGGELSVGRTVCDFRFRSRRPANVHFAMDADEPKFVAMLTEILGRTA